MARIYLDLCSRMPGEAEGPKSRIFFPHRFKNEWYLTSKEARLNREMDQAEAQLELLDLVQRSRGVIACEAI